MTLGAAEGGAPIGDVASPLATMYTLKEGSGAVPTGDCVVEGNGSRVPRGSQLGRGSVPWDACPRAGRFFGSGAALAADPCRESPLLHDPDVVQRCVRDWNSNMDMRILASLPVASSRPLRVSTALGDTPD